MIDAAKSSAKCSSLSIETTGTAHTHSIRATSANTAVFERRNCDSAKTFRTRSTEKIWRQSLPTLYAITAAKYKTRRLRIFEKSHDARYSMHSDTLSRKAIATALQRKHSDTTT